MSLVVIGVNALAAIGLGWVLAYLWPIVVIGAMGYFFFWLQRRARDE